MPTGDGSADVLWHNDSSGVMVLWQMSGSNVVSERYIGALDPSWKPVEAGDYNGDGTADVLWRNTSGAVAEWLMSSGNVAYAGIVGTSFGNGWHII